MGTPPADVEQAIPGGIAIAPRGRSFAGCIAIVCGGSKGIGQSTARELVRRGASVCLMARDEEALVQAGRALERERTGDVFVDVIACDATHEGRVAGYFEEFIERRGVPDYLVNLVGCARPDYLEHFEVEDFREAMEANYIGQLVPTLAILPHFVARGAGHIALTSSILGFMGAMGYATYTPAKYAVVGLAEVLRHEYGDRGITFSVLFPPDTDTPGFAVENETKPAEWFATSATKLMDPDDVARVFVQGLLKDRFYILPGQSAWLRRLARLAPGMLHWYADRELAAARRKLGNA